MNNSERIKEFKLQAVLFALEKCNGQPYDSSYVSRIDIMMQEFAELIIRECANIANGGIDPNEDYLIGDDILKHFGVTEK